MKFKFFIGLILFILFIENSLGNEEIIDDSDKRKFIIGYSGAPLSVDYWRKLKDSLFSKAKELDIVVIDFTSDLFTYEAQKKNLMNAIELKVDGMIIGSVSSKTAELMEDFQTNKIPVIAVGVPIQNKWVTTSITINNSNAARMAGSYILKELMKRENEAKRIIILCGDKSQKDAITRAFVPTEMFTNAGYHVTNYYSKGWSGKHSLTDAIKEYSKYKNEIIASFSCFADATIASVEAAEHFGLRPLQVGFDMDVNMKKMMINGRLDATIIQDPQKIGQVGIESMAKLLNSDTELPKIINISPLLVISDNLR